MEHAPFSNQGLEPERLEKEEGLWVQKREQVEDFLKNEIDFTAIGDIIGEMYFKSRPDAPERGQDDLRKYRFSNIYDPKYEVQYVYSDNGKAVTAQAKKGRIHFSARSFFENNELNRALLLHVTIHELCHLASLTVSFDSKTERTQLSGVSSVTYNVQALREDTVEGKDKELEVLFSGLNEGITEFVSDAVYSEYLARTGKVLETVYQKGFVTNEVHGLIETPVTYYDERIAAYELIEKISQESELPMETVTEGFVQAYLRNERLDSEDLLSFFDEDSKAVLFLNKLKGNDIAKHEHDKQRFLVDILPNTERIFVKALFGRDVVGTYNKNIIESL